MSREEIDPDGIAHSSGANELWAAADIGSLMLAGCPLDESSISCVGFYRSLSAKPFSPRDQQIAHVVLGEVPWLHQSGWPEDRGVEVPQLYPRQRMVLNLLLDGMCRKQIAGHMEITENTVSGYIKAVYKHFEVNSHVDLMSRFLHARAS